MFNKKELAQRKAKRLKELGPGPHDWDCLSFLIGVGGARGELKARLNAQLKGIDPGEPVHWRGL